jgi:hypothetical protein
MPANLTIPSPMKPNEVSVRLPYDIGQNVVWRAVELGKLAGEPDAKEPLSQVSIWLVEYTYVQ